MNQVFVIVRLNSFLTSVSLRFIRCRICSCAMWGFCRKRASTISDEKSWRVPIEWKHYSGTGKQAVDLFELHAFRNSLRRSARSSTSLRRAHRNWRRNHTCTCSIHSERHQQSSACSRLARDIHPFVGLVHWVRVRKEGQSFHRLCINTDDQNMTNVLTGDIVIMQCSCFVPTLTSSLTNTQ